MAKNEYMTIGAMIQCNMGTIPLPISLPMNHGVTTSAGMKMLLNANDHLPMMNILPFGLCKLKPPTPPGVNLCIPMTIQAWKSGDLHCMIGGAPALTKDSFLSCTMGGMIKFK